MNYKGFLIINLLSFAFLGGCKTSHHDTVISFRTYFKPKDDSSFAYCFEYLHAVGKSDLTACVDSINNYIDLPLDINSDHSVFIFQKENNIDTLTLKYKRKIKGDDKDVEMEVSDVQLEKTTFDSVKVFNSSNSGNDIESITIYY